jgi:curli biogenesis system outer membrane secretion channel CsgG
MQNAPQPAPPSSTIKVFLILGGFAAATIGSCIVGIGIGSRSASQAALKNAQPSIPAAPPAVGKVAAPAQQEATAEEPKPEIRVLKVTDILSVYKENEVRADQQFKGNLVQITGKVGEVKKDILDDMYVTVGTGARYEIPVVQCMLDEAQAGRAAQLSKGADVTVRGRVDGLLMNVIVRDCKIQD